MLALVTLGAIGSSALAARRHGVRAPSPTIQVLSGRSNLVSGGEALIAVAVPRGAKPSALTLTLAGRNVTGAFAVRQNGLYEGLVTGIPNASNLLPPPPTAHPDPPPTPATHPL